MPDSSFSGGNPFVIPLFLIFVIVLGLFVFTLVDNYESPPSHNHYNEIQSCYASGGRPSYTLDEPNKTFVYLKCIYSTD
jgi:hypothetical protein